MMSRARLAVRGARVPFLAIFSWNRPRAVNRDVVPTHGSNFLSALAGEQQQANHCAEGAVRLGSLPHSSQFIVIENPISLSWCAAPHPLNDRRAVVIFSCRKPIRHRTENRQTVVGLASAVLRLDLVEQPGNVTPPDAGELSACPFTQHELEKAIYSVDRAKPTGLTMKVHPL